MNLYEQTKQLEFLLMSAIDIETGEILSESKLELFEQMDGQRDEKILNLGKYIKEQKIYLSALKAEKQRIDAKKKVCENNIARLTRYLFENWKDEKISDDQIQLKRNIGTVQIKDSSLIPEAFKTKEVKTEIKVSKKLIKEVILNGGTVEGAVIEPSLGIR